MNDTSVETTKTSPRKGDLVIDLSGATDAESVNRKIQEIVTGMAQERGLPSVALELWQHGISMGPNDRQVMREVFIDKQYAEPECIFEVENKIAEFYTPANPEDDELWALRARRAVLAVNAVRGIPDESLASGIIGRLVLGLIRLSNALEEANPELHDQVVKSDTALLKDLDFEIPITIAVGKDAENSIRRWMMTGGEKHV